MNLDVVVECNQSFDITINGITVQGFQLVDEMVGIKHYKREEDFLVVDDGGFYVNGLKSVSIVDKKYRVIKMSPSLINKFCIPISKF